MSNAINNKKIIVICHNYEPDHTPKKPDADNRFYTYGFGGNMGKNIKHFLPEYDVEVWRLDGYVDKYYEGMHLDVKFRIFPSIYKKNLFDFSYKFIRELKKEVKITNPILICLHTHYWLAYQVMFLFKNSPLITTHHGDWSPFFRIKNSSGLRKLKARLDMFFERKIFKNIDYIFTSEINQFPYFKMANPGFKYFLWSTGVNIDNMIPIPRADAKKQLGWDPNKKYILYVGKMYKFKQADDLIRTWQEIKKDRPRTELVIIGNTPGDPWEEFHEMGEKSGAIMLGRVLNKDLHIYYSAADVYVLFAVRDDYFGGTGISTLESLACNTPVVSYALRNYIGENVHELGEMPNTTEKHKDAILKVLDHPENYKNMRLSVQKYYSYESMYKRMKPVFEELFESRAKK